MNLYGETKEIPALLYYGKQYNINLNTPVDKHE